MFIKDSDNGLVFVKSKNIKAFPCGRRRSMVDGDGDDGAVTVSDRYYIPFDPEARLNTEANNRKHSSLNGFKQNYLNYCKDNALSLVLTGYFFNIQFDDKYDSAEAAAKAFGDGIEATLGYSTDSIYANIKLASVKFFSGSDSVPEAVTEILRDQALNGEPAPCLDFPINGEDKEKSSSYYFSGLSFSSTLLEDEEGATSRTVSMQILAKGANGWQIYEPSRLPNIDHGDTENSLKTYGDLNVGGILTASSIRLGNDSGTAVQVPSLKVEETDTGSYRLRFSFNNQ